MDGRSVERLAPVAKHFGDEPTPRGRVLATADVEDMKQGFERALECDRIRSVASAECRVSQIDPERAAARTEEERGEVAHLLNLRLQSRL